MRDIIKSLAIAIIGIAACVGFALLGAAPVPKQAPLPKPTKLTPELLKGCWDYEWGGMREGWIVFDGKGNYSAQHDPRGTVTYSGTVVVNDPLVIITEWGADSSTGNSWGPMVYIFDLEDSLKGWPTLGGKSTGGIAPDALNGVAAEATIHLKLSNKK